LPLVQVSLLLLLVVNALPSSTAAGPPNAQQQSGGTGSAYLYELNVTSNSDWTNVALSGGPKVLGFNASAVQGAQAPGFRYVAQPSGISMNKKSMDTTTVKFRMEMLAIAGEPSGNVSITKGNLGSTNATLAFYKEGKFQAFMEVVDYGVTGGLNTRNATVDYSTLYDNPSDSVAQQGIPPSLYHKVLAFYYPWYGNPAGPSGQWSHWVDVTPNLILSATDYPLFGAYDSQDSTIIRAQILLARQAGIDGFISSWWGINDFTDHSFSVLLHVAEQMNFTVTIYYETVRSLTSTQMVQELSYVVKQYGSNPAFLKANGLPVIFVYAVDAENRNASFWQSVRNGLESNVGPVYLVGDVTDGSFINVFDGFHNYIQLNCSQMIENYNFFTKSMSLGLADTSWNSAVSHVQHGTPLPVEDKALFFTVIPGNDRLGANRTGGGPILLVDREGGKTYAQFWSAAVSSNATGVLITSWNEWHEGTELEPSRQYGFSYLHYTREWTDLYKHGSAALLNLPKMQVTSSAPVARQTPGASGVNITLLNSGNVPALFDNVTITPGQNTSLNGFVDRDFLSYSETKGSERYNAMIPLVMSGESVTIGVTYGLSSGEGALDVGVQSFNAAGNSTGVASTRLALVGISATTTTSVQSSTTSVSSASLTTTTGSSASTTNSNTSTTGSTPSRASLDLIYIIAAAVVVFVFATTLALRARRR